MVLNSLTSCGLTGFGSVTERTFSAQEANSLGLTIDMSLGTVAREPRLFFKMSFIMPRDSLVLKLPDVFLRKDKLYNRMEELTVSDEGELLPSASDPSIILLKHPEGERVTISYLFRPDDPENTNPTKASFSAPIIRENYFQFVGLMAFVYPLALIEAPSFSVTFNWHVPKNVDLFNSFSAYRTRQTVTTNFDRLRDAFFAGGSSMRIYETKVREQPVYITLEGEWQEINDEEFVDVVTKLLAKQRETWRDYNFPYFLVSFLSSESDCNGNINFAGTAHPNSFRAFFPSGCKFIPEMKQLISHELTHMWIGKKIKMGSERGHIDGKWLTEGFSDFYGRILAFRAGVMSEKEYFATLDRQLERYYVSPAKNTPLKEVVFRMYKNGYSTRSLEELPYEQGEIMAMVLNYRIEKESNFAHSLDDVIRDMLAEADRAGGSKNFSADEIAQIMDRYANHVFKEELSKVRDGKSLSPPRLPGCSIMRAEFISNRFSSPSKVSEGIFYQGSDTRMCRRWLDG